MIPILFSPLLHTQTRRRPLHVSHQISMKQTDQSFTEQAPLNNVARRSFTTPAANEPVSTEHKYPPLRSFSTSALFTTPHWVGSPVALAEPSPSTKPACFNALSSTRRATPEVTSRSTTAPSMAASAVAGTGAQPVALHKPSPKPPVVVHPPSGPVNTGPGSGSTITDKYWR